ncbi:protein DETOXIFICATION 55-like [Cucurbita moschata]|uniref:Protein DETOXIFICATION n=1 Tax=Cucurbita moschata TaxID=3662 RepID=A0A6J1H342_CUCMO|nr:protein DETOXIFICATION 55-like [Cucurbita moschata]
MSTEKRTKLAKEGKNMLAEEKFQKYPTMAEVLDELKQMADIGFPVLAIGLVGYLKNMISVICMGRLGTLHLAAGSLAIGFTNITGYSILSGLAMGMEPLCSQAFGSHNSSIAFLTLQRTVLILLFASIPIGFLWLNLEPLMLVLHQNPEITRIAAVYCRFAVPDLVLNSLLHPLRIYLRNKGTTWLVMWCNLLAILLHVPIAIFLTFSLDLGIRGIALSNFIANFNTLFFLLLYLTFNTRSTLSASSSKEANLFVPLKSSTAVSAATVGEDWGMLIKLAIPSCLGVCLEWWWYEFMTILTGYLYNPRIALATSGIVIQTTSLMYTLPTALSAAVSTRVGHELGAGGPKKARLAGVVAIGLALVGSLMGLSLTTIGRRTWGRVFTKDEEILELTMAVLPIVGLCELANSPQTTSCGILRGSARPGIGAGINFCSFYMVGAPVAVLSAFVWKFGFVGLCYGLLAAQMACVVSILIVVFNTDWELESIKAEDLVGKNTDNVFAHASHTAIREEGPEFLKEPPVQKQDT